MDEGDGPDADALSGRVPRTDWFLRPRRAVFVPAALEVGLLAAIVHSARQPGGVLTAGSWICAATAAAATFLLAYSTFRLSRWVRERRHRKSVGSSAPWLRHRYWSNEGETRFVALSGSIAIEKLRNVLACTAFFSIAGSVALGVMERRAEAIAAVFAGVASLAVLAATAWRGFANLRLRWHEFPLRTGGPVRLGFEFKRGGKPLERLALTLRCVVETPRGGGLLRPDVRCVYARTVERGEEVAQGGGEIGLVFDVPADLPGADPFGTPAVFWEMAVACEGPSFRYDGTFPVPLYPR